MQLAAVLGIAIATYFLVDLTRTAWKNYQLARIIQDQQKQIDQLNADIDRLAQVKKTIESDAFVEMWARQRGWTRKGEVRIVTVPSAPAEDELARLLLPAAATGPPGFSSKLQAWRALFVDSQ